MISAFGVDHGPIAKASAKEQHYGRMAGTFGVMGAAATPITAGSAIIGHAERKGKDPMNFTGDLTPAKKVVRLAEVADAHKYQVKVGGGLAAASLGLAGAYKHKQRKLRQQQLRKSMNKKRLDRAGDAGLAVGGAAVGAGALTQGAHMAAALNEHANAGLAEARYGHHVLAAHKAAQKVWEGGKPIPKKELAEARRLRTSGVRVALVKKPAALLATGAAAAGGAGLYEMGRYAAKKHKDKQ